MNEQQIRQIIKEELSHLMKSDRFTFEKTLQILDGRSIIIGRDLGSQIGTSATQKIGIWGATPIVQPSSSGTTLNMTIVGGTAVTESNGFTGNTGSTAYTIGDVVKHLKTIGALHT